MVALALAVSSSVLWGISDFLGGLKSRRFPATVVLVCAELTSLVVMGVFVAARGTGPPGTDAIITGLGSGLFGIAGLIAFYRALAIGTMSVVAPIASTGVALPVLAGIATGDQPGPLRSIGLCAAVIGVVLASRDVPSGHDQRRSIGSVVDEDGHREAARTRRSSVVLAGVAGVGFGMYFLLAEISSRGDVGWALLLSRVAATPFVASFALVALRRGGRRPNGRDLAVLVGIGVLDLGANVLYNYSTTLGELSTVSVGSSLYPVMTVVMAAALLGERLRGIQRTGVVVALCGVVLIAAGA